MKRWIDTCHQAIHENETGLPSTTRIAVLVSSLTLSLSTIVLTFATVLMKDGMQLVPALSVVAGALGGMAGGSYMAGRAWNRPRGRVDNPDAL